LTDFRVPRPASRVPVSKGVRYTGRIADGSANLQRRCRVYHQLQLPDPGRHPYPPDRRKTGHVTLSRFFGNLVKILTLTFVIIITIGKFGISIAPFIAALGAIAFGTSFAIAGPVSNYGAGLVIILTRPFVVGNTITIKGVSGVVDEIHLAVTILSTEDDEVITIPNKHIVGEILHNSFENRIVETTVGISYDDNPEQAVEVLRQTLAGIDGVCSEPPPQIGIEAFGESSIDLGLRYWVPTKKYFQTLYRTNLAVHKALATAGITIPFPQHDVHMKGSEVRSKI
jgi:small conductance mechanosensitive channel